MKHDRSGWGDPAWMRPRSEMGSPGKRLPLCPAAAEKRRCAERAKLGRYVTDDKGRIVGRPIPPRLRPNGTWTARIPAVQYRPHSPAPERKSRQ